MRTLRGIIKFMSIAVSAFALSSCFDSAYSENYTLIASFEYGKQVTLRPDSTYFTTDGYLINVTTVPRWTKITMEEAYKTDVEEWEEMGSER